MFGKSLIFLGFLCLSCINSENAEPFYRSDYTYNRDVDGWLKFHAAPVKWSDARDICRAEGAVLAAPITEKLHAAILKQVPDAYSSLFIGVHSKYANGMFTSIRGVPLYKMPISWAQGEPNNLDNSESCLAINIHSYTNSVNPTRKFSTASDVKCSNILQYVCYKKANHSMVMNTACGTYDFEYQFESRTGSCYKFHRYGSTWSEAARTCMAEQGHLIIINSEEEAQVLKEIYARNPEKTIFAVFPYASIGTYLDIDSGYWLTVQGQTPLEAGYNTWQPGEPNNGTQPRGEFCGCTHRNNGFLHDAPCHWIMPFICEKKPATYENIDTVLY